MELQNANKTHQHGHERKAQPSSRPELATEVAVHPMLALHRAVGNRALARLIQAKLTVSHPGDKYEQEADRTAEAVMRMPEAWVHRQEVRNPDRRSGDNSKTLSVQMQVEEEEEPIQRQPVNEEEPLSISRLPEEEQEEPLQTKLILPSHALQRQQMEEEEKLQTKELGDQLPQVTPALENRIYALRAGGQPLPASLQTFYESRFGYDFGAVRVHTDAQAADLARQVHAQAFTVGSDVVFGNGHYDPDSIRGKMLLAHELTHVVQQGAAIQRKPRPVSTAQRQIQREGDDESWFSKAKKAVGGAVSGGLEWVLKKIKEFAAKIPGYKLLSVILGKDPVTDERVDRNAENLIGGFLSLIPGGNTIFENLKKSGALAEALGWLNEQITKLELTWDKIKGLFSQAVKALSPTDILDISGAAQKVVSVFDPPLARIKNFAVAAGQKLLEFVFKGALNLAGPLGAKVLEVLKKAGAVFSTIIKDPVGFLGNLLKALKRGFEQFSANILEHLKAGLIGWLLGALQGAGLQLPEKFDIKGILSIVVQLLGLTYDFLHAKLVKLIGEERVAFIEKTFDFVKTLATEGLAAAWEKIVEFFGSLKDIVIGAIREWVVTQVVKSAITKLVTMFNPVGAVIQAIMAIYNTIMFFIERFRQIAALAEAVFDSIANIAAGNISAAANYVEKTMGRTIPVVISFLAELLGLGGISEKIKNIITGIRDRVDKAIDKLVSFIVGKVEGLFKRGEDEKGQAINHEDRWQNGVEGVKKEIAKLSERELSEENIKIQLPQWREKYGFQALSLNIKQTPWVIEGEMSPGKPVAKVSPTGPNGSRERPYPLFWPKEFDSMPEVVLHYGLLKRKVGAPRDEELPYQTRLKHNFYLWLLRGPKPSDPKIVKNIREALRARLQVREEITEERFDELVEHIHFHHIHPLFLDGEDSEENMLPVNATKHLQGHVRLRYQSGAPAPPEGMPKDRRDLYDKEKHPDGTHYRVIDEF